MINWQRLHPGTPTPKLMTARSSHPLPSLALSLCLLLACSLLSACDLQGLLKDSKVEAREAEGRAIGSACRHSGRALEDCYALNPKVIKAAIFNGWRDMDAYMRENKITAVPATLMGQSAEQPVATETENAQASEASNIDTSADTSSDTSAATASTPAPASN